MKTRTLKLHATALLLSLAASFAFGQAGAGTQSDLKLDDVFAPENPAYAVLGISPTEVLKPTSPKAFAVSLYENGIDEDGSLVSDFAMQLTPYWWTDRPDLTWDGYNGYDSAGTYTRPHPFDVMQQSLSFALATSTATDQTAAAGGGNAQAPANSNRLLSASVGFDILRGKPSQKLLASKANLVQFLGNESARQITVIRSLAAARTAEAQALFPGVSVDDMTFQDWGGTCTGDQASAGICQAFNEQVNSPPEYTRLVGEVNANSNERVGHRLQFNSAFVYFIPDSSFDAAELARSSYWLSYSYVRDKGLVEGASPLKVVGLLKYNRTDDVLDKYLPAATLDKSTFDIGARIVWESKAYPLNASIEYVHRDSDDNTDSERFTALVDYQINDNMAVVFAVGQNLESDITPLITGEDTLVSLGFKLNTDALTGKSR